MTSDLRRVSLQYGHEYEFPDVSFGKSSCCNQACCIGTSFSPCSSAPRWSEPGLAFVQQWLLEQPLVLALALELVLVLVLVLGLEAALASIFVVWPSSGNPHR